MTIYAYLDLSTAHLRRETMDTLSDATEGTCQARGWPAMTIAPYEYGDCIAALPHYMW